MQEEILFTALMTTFNRRDLLPRAIHSVLNQTFRHLELLIIDNGSQDDTRTIVENIQDERIKYVLNPNPTDSCEAPRNLGIQHSMGKFISFLDDDDIWYPKKLEKVKEAFEQDPDVAAVNHSLNKRVKGKLDGTIKYGVWTPDFYEKLLYEENTLGLSAMSIKANWLKRLNGFNLKKEISSVADYELWLRLAMEKAKIHFIHEPLGEWSLTGHNFSLVDPSQYEKILYIVKEHIYRHEKTSLWKISKKGMWRLLQLNYLSMRSFFHAKKIKKTFEYFFHVFLIIILKPLLIQDLFFKLKNKIRPQL